jgi:hypothetical protein
MEAANQWEKADRQQLGTYRGVMRLTMVTTVLLVGLLIVLALTLL